MPDPRHRVGPVDRDRMSLVSLPTAERAGLIFVSLDPKATIDLDEWLGAELIQLLEALALDRCFHHSTRTLDGPNWKVVVDGYLEGYHFASLHRTTVFRTNFSNMAAFDNWGPHQRNSFALRPIADAANTPRDSWDPATCVGAIFWLFPGLAIAGGWRSQIAVSLVLPGTTWESSKTQQLILLRAGRRGGAQGRRPHPGLVPRRGRRRGLQRRLRRATRAGLHG